MIFIVSRNVWGNVEEPGLLCPYVCSSTEYLCLFPGILASMFVCLT